MKRILLVAVLVLALQIAGVAGAGAGNEAPLPDAGLDQHVDLGATVLLDATGSRDPNGEIAGYEWVIEAPDGTMSTPACQTCARTNFVVGQVGRYDVTVRVTDDDGAVRTDTLYVYVEGEREEPSDRDHSASPEPSDPPSSHNEPGLPDSLAHDFEVPTSVSADAGWEIPPAFYIECPDEVDVGEPAECSATTARLDAPLSFAWSNGVSGPTSTYIWSEGGTKTVVASVEDADGTTLSDSATVRVVENDPPRVQIATPDSLSPGKSVTLTTKVKEDPDGFIVGTEWSPSRTVKVPTDGEPIQVSVIVMDDDGATAMDSITLTGETQTDTTNQQIVYKSGANWHDPLNLKSGAKCAVKKWSGSGQCNNGMYRNAEGDIVVEKQGVWLATPHSEEAQEFYNSQLNSSNVNGGEPLDSLTGSTSSDSATMSESTTTTSSASVADTLEPFTMDGQTVSSDLNGDGKIDTADWSQRYEETTTDTSDQSFKDTYRERQQTRNQAQSNENTYDNTDFKSSGGGSSDSGGTTDSGSSTNGPMQRKADQLTDGVS